MCCVVQPKITINLTFSLSQITAFTHGEAQQCLSDAKNGNFLEEEQQKMAEEEAERKKKDNKKSSHSCKKEILGSLVRKRE